MGSVFAAIREGQKGVDRTVAIKLLNSSDQSPEELEAFVQEARLTARIAHPNVLDTFELDIADGEPFLVMPLVRGVSLSKLLKPAEPLDPDMAAWIAMQIAAGLHAAHELEDEDGTPLGVIHRDVSPQNVLLSFDGRVLLVDFGVAKLFEGARATASGVIKGKFGYMAPEQLRGEPLDRRTDVFALGIVLYEMLTGRPLYASLPPAQATFRITTDPVPKARDLVASVPAELDDVIASCLAKAPAERFDSALEVKDALRAILRARSAGVDESDLAALLSSRFGAERAAFDERIRAALTDRSPSIETADDDVAPQFASQGSKVTMTSSPLVAPARERRAWPYALLGAGALAAAALAITSGDETAQAPAATATTPPVETEAPAPTAAPSPTTTALATAEPAAPPPMTPSSFPQEPGASATAAPPRPPAAPPTASASTPPSPAPAKSTDPRGVPFRDL